MKVSSLEIIVFAKAAYYLLQMPWDWEYDEHDGCLFFSRGSPCGHTDGLSWLFLPDRWPLPDCQEWQHLLQIPGKAKPSSQCF